MEWVNGFLKFHKNWDSIYIPAMADDLVQEVMQTCMTAGIGEDYVIAGPDDRGGIAEYNDGGEDLWIWAHGNADTSIGGGGTFYNVAQVAGQLGPLDLAGSNVIVWSCHAGAVGGFAQGLAGHLGGGVTVWGNLFLTGGMTRDCRLETINPMNSALRGPTKRNEMRSF